MQRWRTIAVLAVALLCLMLFGQVARAQQAKPPEPGGATSEGRPPEDDDDVIVRPKGKNVTKKTGDQNSMVDPFGFAWTEPNDVLRKGKAKKFRCDLYQNLTKLQAAVTVGGALQDADAVNFDLEGFVFEVIKIKGGKYIWYIPQKTPKPCKKNKNCKESGVPPEYMDGKLKDGTLSAKFIGSPDYVEVEEVRMRGSECK